MIKAREKYGLKRYSATWREKLAETLKSLGYKSSETDADVWMKRDLNPNGDPYYKYILCKFDDLLHIGLNPKEYMDELNLIHRLKEVFGPPERYLCDNVDKVQLEDGKVV